MRATALSLGKWNGGNVEPTCLGEAGDVESLEMHRRQEVEAAADWLEEALFDRLGAMQRCESDCEDDHLMLQRSARRLQRLSELHADMRLLTSRQS